MTVNVGTQAQRQAKGGAKQRPTGGSLMKARGRGPLLVWLASARDKHPAYNCTSCCARAHANIFRYRDY